MAILVCGGAGYIGSHMTAALVARGTETVVLDNLCLGHRQAVWPGAKFYEGDIRDEHITDRVFGENNIEAVADFAAYAVVAESVRDPMMYYENNVFGGMCLLKAMIKHNVRRIVFSSTASTYGEPTQIPVTEDMPQLPINPYGETKLAFERTLKWYGPSYGLSHIVLRYFNVAGAHKSGMIGEDHNPETHLIPQIIQAALGKQPVFKLFGNDYDTPDGTCIRDYIHIDDLIDAHLLALDWLDGGGNSAAYNLGSGNGFSNKQILDAVMGVTGLDIPVEYAPRRPGDPPVLVASSEKIRKELGWNPTRTNLDAIIGTAWAWHFAHREGY